VITVLPDCWVSKSIVLSVLSFWHVLAATPAYEYIFQVGLYRSENFPIKLEYLVQLEVGSGVGVGVAWVFAWGDAAGFA